MWTSTSYTGAKSILTGHARVFLLTSSGVIGLDQETGRLLYRISGNFTQWAYAGDNLPRSSVSLEPERVSRP
jgi:hypothetical protein